MYIRNTEDGPATGLKVYHWFSDRLLRDEQRGGLLFVFNANYSNSVCGAADYTSTTDVDESANEVCQKLVIFIICKKD